MFDIFDIFVPDKNRNWLVGLITRAIRVSLHPSRIMKKLKIGLGYLKFRIQMGDYVSFDPIPAPNGRNLVIISLEGSHWVALVESFLARAFQLRGYEVIVVSFEGNLLSQMYFRVFGIKTILIYEKILSKNELENLQRHAKASLRGISNVDELVSMKYSNVDSGLALASRAIRVLHVGQLDLNQPGQHKVVEQQLFESFKGIAIVNKLLERFGSSGAVLAVEKFYTPWRELFDSLVKAGRDGFIWNMSCAKSNSLALKRYRPTDPPESLSDALESVTTQTFHSLDSLTWTHELEEMVLTQIRGNYQGFSESNPVYGLVHNGKKIMDRGEICDMLKINPKKKIAAIFAHVFWDAALCFGYQIFNGFEEWLLETINIAINVADVEWIVKFHPGNMAMVQWDGFVNRQEEMAEADQMAIHRRFGTLPNHIKTIPHDSEINTFSLFDVVDVCLSVSSTIAVEMPCFGIPVIIPGFQRTSGFGFTYDCRSREEYFSLLRTISSVPTLNREQQIQAQKHALCYFLLRPFQLQSLRLDFGDGKVTPDVLYKRPHDVRSLSETQDVKTFAEWALDSKARDFVDWGELNEIVNRFFTPTAKNHGLGRG